MSLDARLNRVVPVLSAKERFLIELRAFKADQPKDPSIRKSLPREQYTVFSRYVALKLAVNVALGEYVTVVVLMIEKLHVRFLLYFTASDLVVGMWQFAKLIPASRRKEAEKIAAQSAFALDLPWTEDDTADSWSKHAVEVRERVKCDLHDRWLDLQAIEVVLDEASEEIDGEDLLHPFMRMQLAHGRSLLELLSLCLECDVPTLSADDNALKNARQFLANGRRIFD